MFGMCKTKHSSKDCNGCLFIVSKADFLWFSWRTPEFINQYLWTGYKIFLSFKYLFHFFSYQWLMALFTRVLLRVTVYYYRVTYAFQSKSALYIFSTYYPKQTQYLKFKWIVTSWKYSHSNIAQTSSLCYVSDF